MRGDKTNAVLSAAACIPVAGWGAAGIKIVNKGAKALNKAGDVYDVGRGAGKAVVIGEGMQDIKTVAKQLQVEGVDAKWYQAWSKNFPNNRPMTPNELNAALARNQRWIDSKMKQGYDIYDIGTDPLRTTRSPFYELEQSRINKYGYPTIDITGRRP